MTAHQWYYAKPGMLEDQTIGPIDHEQFLAEIRSETIQPEWNVFSETATRGQWLAMQDLPKLMEIRQKAIERREAEEQSQRESDQQRQAAEAAERQRAQKALREQANADAEAKRQHREAQAQQLAERKRVEPPQPPVANGFVAAIFALCFFGALFFGCGGLISAKTVYQEIEGIATIGVATLFLIAALLATVDGLLRWIGKLLIWKNERDNDRLQRR